jgi:hypothetical protein
LGSLSGCYGHLASCFGSLNYGAAPTANLDNIRRHECYSRCHSIWLYVHGIDKEGIAIKKTAIVLGVILAVILLFWGSTLIHQTQIQKTAKGFLTAISEGNFEQAAALSTGRAALSVSTRKNLPVARVVSIQTSSPAYSGHWAKVDAMVELELQNESMDIGWYSLTLRRDGKWKVYSVISSNPQLFGRDTRISESDLNSIESVFREYTGLISKGKYSEATVYLAGPARIDHERSLDTLPPGGVGKEVTDVTIEPLWRNGSLAVVGAAYNEHTVIITAWKSPKGWLMARLD